MYLHGEELSFYTDSGMIIIVSVNLSVESSLQKLSYGDFKRSRKPSKNCDCIAPKITLVCAISRVERIVSIKRMQF